jgi:DNA processing protein
MPGGMSERVLTPTEPGYPWMLRHIAEPPVELFACGALARELGPESPFPPAVAIVGARDATAYGLAVARELGRELARRGLVVVSGLAIGIDGAAHRGAIEVGGRTVAVVGSGTDVVYPRAHARLRDEILACGAVFAEHPRGSPPLAHHFPRRNRLISGLSLGVVVVEATLRSGSLGTAAHALEQGRDVFAVPGPVASPRSRGPHWLLKQGAKLVETVDDIVAELPPGVRAMVEQGPGRVSRVLPHCVGTLRRIAEGASSAEEIAAVEHRQISEIWAELLELELLGEVLRQPGGRFGIATTRTSVTIAGSGGRVDCPSGGS